jgi:hypothetical protein
MTVWDPEISRAKHLPYVIPMCEVQVHNSRTISATDGHAIRSLEGEPCTLATKHTGICYSTGWLL